MKIWGTQEYGKCECDEKQNLEYLFACSLQPIKCKKKNFITTDISDKTIKIAAYWEEQGI